MRVNSIGMMRANDLGSRVLYKKRNDHNHACQWVCCSRGMRQMYADGIDAAVVMCRDETSTAGVEIVPACPLRSRTREGQPFTYGNGTGIAGYRVPSQDGRVPVLLRSRANMVQRRLLGFGCAHFG